MPPYPTLEHTRRALDIHVREARAGNPAFWALIERTSGELIGDAGLAPIEGVGPEIETGYTLGRRWCGRDAPRLRRGAPAVRGALPYLTVSVPSMPAALWLPTGQ